MLSIHYFCNFSQHLCVMAKVDILQIKKIGAWVKHPAMTEGRILLPTWLKHNFSSLTLPTFWAREFFAVGGCTMPCRMLASILDLYPLDTSNTASPHTPTVVTTKNVSRNCRYLLRHTVIPSWGTLVEKNLQGSFWYLYSMIRLHRTLGHDKSQTVRCCLLSKIQLINQFSIHLKYFFNMKTRKISLYKHSHLRWYIF